MVFVVAGIFLLIGVWIGQKIVWYIFGKMCEQGQIVFKSDNEWVGEDEALDEIKRKEWLKK
jgi:hypothetical protein